MPVRREIPAFIARVTLLAAAAIAFVWLVTGWSYEHFRLPLLSADDSAYLSNAGLFYRKQALQSGSRLLYHLRQALGMHSPGAYVVALLGFELGGLTERSAYLANSLYVFLYLLLVERLMRATAFRIRILWLAFALTVPLAALGAHELRPDFAAAVLIAAAVAILFDRRAGPPAAAVRRHAASGLCYGLALFWKPSISLFTLSMILFSFMVAYFTERRDLKKQLFGALGVLVPAAPYFAVSLRTVIDYTDIVRTSPYMYMYAGPPGHWQQLGFYLWGEGAAYTLRYHALILVVLFLAGAFALSRRGRPFRVDSEAGNLLCIVACAIFAYCFATASPFKSPFFAQPFHLLLLTGALISARQVVAPGPQAALAAGALVAGALLAFPPHLPHELPQECLATEKAACLRIPRELVRRLDTEPTFRRASGREPIVYVVNDGIASAENLTWAAVLVGLRHWYISDHLVDMPPVADKAGLFMMRAREADYVVTADRGALGVSEDAPWAECTDKVLSGLRSDGRFAPLLEIPDGHGKKYYLFRNSRPEHGPEDLPDD